MNTIESEALSLKEYWRLRDEQMLLDREILNLVKPVQTSDVIKWISNEPKVFYETATSLISSYPPRFRLPLSINYTPEERDKMNKAERLLLGIWRQLDERQFQNYWLRQLAYRILSGWHAVFVMVQREKEEVKFIADIWDPITVYPEWNADGLITVARIVEMDKRTARSIARGFLEKGANFEYKEGDTETIRLINYWKNDRGKIYNAILLGSEEAKPLKEEKHLDKIPIDTGAIGVPDQTSGDWPLRFGESIIAANRDMYEYENSMISLMATIMAETAYPNIVTTSRTGAPIMKKGMKGYGDIHQIALGEKIELLKHASTPEEVNLLLAYVGKQKQKGAVPDIVYGGVPFELSGFAISQLMASIRYKISPYLNRMQKAIGAIGSDLLYQYKRGDAKGMYPKITLSTSNRNQMKKGLFFVEEFSPKDVPDVKFVEVTIPITSAMDKTQQMLFAKQAVTPPQLLSRETLWDEILDVQDSDQEYTRILQDEMMEMPIIKQIAMIEQLRIRRDGYNAQNMNAEAMALNRYIMMLEMELGMRKGIPTAPGVSPEQMPPEMINNPDMGRAALGVPPPGLNRRPQTPEERRESQGRKGVLVSPSGETLL